MNDCNIAAVFDWLCVVSLECCNRSLYSGYCEIIVAFICRLSADEKISVSLAVSILHVGSGVNFLTDNRIKCSACLVCEYILCLDNYVVNRCQCEHVRQCNIVAVLFNSRLNGAYIELVTLRCYAL